MVRNNSRNRTVKLREAGSIQSFREVPETFAVEAQHSRLDLRLAVGKFERRHRTGNKGAAVVPVAGLGGRDEKCIDRVAWIGGRLLIGIDEIEGAGETVRSGSRLLREVVEE